MDEQLIRQRVTAEYKTMYPEWRDLKILEVSRTAFKGSLVVVSAKFADGRYNEEVCFVDFEERVRIFGTTIELARFLEERANAALLERVFNRSNLTGMAFLILIFAIFLSGFFHFNEQALAILGSVVGSAGGYFFATEGRATADAARHR